MGGGRGPDFGDTNGGRNPIYGEEPIPINGPEGPPPEIPPILDPTNVEYVEDKMEGYLLNPDHEDGKSKAKYFKEVLGYGRGDGRTLHDSIVDSLIGKLPESSKETQYGIRHVFETVIKGKGDKTIKANVIVVVQKDNDKIVYRIITAYPGKKEGQR